MNYEEIKRFFVLMDWIRGTRFEFRYVGDHPDRLARLRYIDLFGNKLYRLNRTSLENKINRLLSEKFHPERKVSRA